MLYKDQALGAAAFDDIKKFAESSIFSVENLTETVIKLKAAGLEPTVAMLKLFANTSSVAADSLGALQAITDLYARTTAGGLGLEDLNRLADRGIPVFTILSQRLGLSRLEIAKVGQTAEGATVILKALEDGLQDAFGTASASRAGNVSQAMGNFGDAVANASDAMGQAGLSAATAKFMQAATQLVQQLTPLIAQIGKGLGFALDFAAENMKVLAAIATGFLGVALSILAQRTLAALKTLLVFGNVIARTPLFRLGQIAVAAAASLGLFAASSAAADAETAKLNETVQDAENGFKVLKDGELGAGVGNLRDKVKELNPELNRFKVEMQTLATDFARFNAETINSINLETQLIGVSSEQVRIRQAQADITKKAADEIAKLTQEKAKLTEAEKTEGREGIIDETIEKIRKQAEVDSAATTEAIKNSEARQRARQFEMFSIENQIDVNRDLRRIQDDIAKSTMNEIQRKHYDILAVARERSNEEIRSEEIRRGSLLTDQEKLRYYEEAVRGTEDLMAAESQLFENNRKFSTGWNRAFSEYVDNATNAARQAETIFKNATQGMEDAIINFARTGKFEFKSFVNSILEDLLRSQVRNLITGALGGGGGGIIGGIGKLLGFANGGIIPTNNPVVVGERGPELLVGAAGNRVIPNEQLGGGSVVYNINAVDALSFKQLLAQDPGFLYGVTMQGAKGIPARR
jgi:lambda family phage tail tape measure protein